MNKFICGLLCFGAIAFSIFTPAAKAAFDESKIKSAAAVLMEPKSGRVFVDKNGSKRLPPASTTKILTALIALETGDLDQVMKAGREINKFSKASSLMGLKEGEEATLRDLLYGMMLVSGNDAAATVGVSLGDSIEGFAKIMNRKADDIGMSDSNFVNPYGTHEDEHYSTARDMAMLAAYAMQNSDFMKIVSTKEYTAQGSKHKNEPFMLKNTNKLVYFDSEKDERDLRYKYATGMKTGLTDPAKGCLVASASKNGIDLVAVILADTSNKYYGRFEEARALFEYGFDNFASVPLADLPLSLDITAPVSGGSEGATVPISVTLGDQTVTGLKDEIESLKRNTTPIKVELLLDKDLAAPVEKGAVVGTVAFRLKDEIIAIVEARAGSAILANEEAPMPTVILVPAAASVKTASGPNPLLYVVLAGLVLMLAYLVLRILRVYNRKRSRARRLSAARRNSPSRKGAVRVNPSPGRKRSQVNRYYMYGDSKR